MPYPKSLQQSFRKNMLLIGAGWRGFFAPFDYVANLTSAAAGPNILDLQRQGPFSSSSPPPGFTDTGWIREMKSTPQDKIGQIRSGYRGAVRAQYRGEIGTQIAFKFREAGRLQYKLASGTQVFNLLAGIGAASTVGPINSAGSTAVPLGASGYVASGAIANFVGQPTLYVPSGSGNAYPVNSYIVADDDYNSASYGVIGYNGAYVFPNQVNDVDFVRKTSDFVARVVGVVVGVGSPVQDALILDQPFVGGGSPAATMAPKNATAKVQKIIGWTQRDGGTFIHEWSGLFIADTVDGAQIAMYFPHLSISASQGIPMYTVENAGTTDLTGFELEASFEALAYDDPLDGETVDSYTAFYPNARVQNTY